MLHEAYDYSAPDESLLPLSTGQMEVWHAQLLQPGSSIYNIGGYLAIDGPVDRAAFQRALRQVIDQTDSHHLIFVETPVGLRAQISRRYADIPFLDFSAEADADSSALAWMHRTLNKPFDLFTGPLFRHALLKISDERYTWFACLHHLVSDAFGMGLFASRLGEAYGEQFGEPRKQAMVTPWRDYLRDEASYRESDAYKRDKQYWRAQLNAYPETATLSGSAAARPDQVIVSTVNVPPSMVTRLGRVGAASNSTLAAVILAATAAHLSRLSGQRDIVLGLPMSGRTSPALRRVFGFLSNVVPLRLDVDPYAPFAGLVKQAGAQALQALRHQRYPAASLRQDLGLVANAPSIYGTVINVLQEDEGTEFAGQHSHLHMFTQTSRVEDMLLTIHVGRETGMRVQFDANSARYDAASLQQIQRSFISLLESVCHSGAGPTALLPLVSALERQHLLYGTAPQDAAAPTPRFLHELFEIQSARTPDAVALVDGSHSLSYAQLNARANRLAHRLIAADVGPETLVGVCIERSAATIVGLLAVSKAGGAYLPLDPSYPKNRLLQMLADASPVLILFSEATARTWSDTDLPPLATRLIIDGEAAMTHESAADTHNPTDRQRRTPLDIKHPAYVIYTSGSTGTPKGVLVTHAGLSALAAASVRHFRVTPQSRLLQYSSLNFDGSVADIVTALSSGAALVLTPPNALSGAPLRQLLADQRISHLLVPAAVLPTLTPGTDLALECLTVGGEACAPARIAEWSASVRMINAYGPTESSVIATLSAALHGSVVAPLGAPIVGTRVYVLDASLEPMPLGGRGELYIAGIGLARGYLGCPAITAERFVPDPYGEPGSRMYRSGDLVLRRMDGNLEFVGRADRQIKLRGFRIELGEIDAALHAIEGVEQAVAIVREDEPGSRYLAAYVVLKSECTFNVAALRAALAVRLPDHMLPAAFVPLAGLPLTSNGKLDRCALPKPGQDAPASSAYEAPRNLTEERLADIWREILHVERVGRNDDFFELGGHSLIALQVIARVRNVFELELPLQDLFAARSLEALARTIDLAVAAREHAPRVAAIRASASQGPAPLSYSQERMWLIQSLNPSTTAYNMGAALHIRGRLDVQNMADSFDQLIDRHEILRSSIRLRDDRPAQIVEPSTGMRLPFVDLREQPDPYGAALQKAVDLSRKPFDLDAEPVIRTALFQIGDEAYILAIVLHHIAGDQWSMGVLGRELASLYNHRRRGVAFDLPALPVSYRDYSLWQRSDAFGAQFEQQLAFWRRQLAALPAVDLPTDHVRPRVWTMNGTYHERQIPPALFEQLKRFSSRAGVTMFMTTFAAFTVLLQRITGQIDLPIGVPVANRTHIALEGLVGTFVNTVVLRNDLSGDPTFETLLHRVRGTALEAFARQDVSFDRLVQEIGQRGDRSRAPLVQVMFNVTNAPMHGIAMDGIEWEPLELDRGGAQFELSFSVDTEISRKITVEYNTDLFKHATIERWVGQYFTLLEVIAAGSTLPISALPLLPAEEWSTLQAWNATDAVYSRDRLFPRLFEEQVARSAQATAITFEGAGCSYGDLNSQANAVARRLGAIGVGPGVLVAVCVSRSPLLLVSLLAIQKTGGAYVPLDPEFPPERLKYMLADSGVKVLVTAGKLPQGFEVPEDIIILDVTPIALAHDGTAANLGTPKASDTAYVIYTSGSTGRPKGVAVSHGALLNFLLSMRDQPGLDATDVLAAVTTISFDIAALELYLPLMVGARIELVSRKTASDGEALSNLLEASGATLLQATPATWRMLLETSWSPGSRFRALSGGEPLSRALADSLLERVGELWNMYGPTETTVWSTLQKVERGAASIDIGRPIANTQVHIMDASGSAAPIGVAGEICIGGAGVATGYHRRPALTAERFIPDPYATAPGARLYRTGDLGRWHDGKLYHLGRSDFQVKIRGYRIELGEIEQVLCAHPAVRQAVVAVREAQQDDPRLAAYVVYREVEEPTLSDMKRYLRDQLPDYMVPSIIMALTSMPLTPNGKLDRGALPDPFGTTQALAAAHDPPATPTEKIIAEIWQSVLKSDHVDAGDNFFELGGYSLLSLRVAKLVEKRTRFRMDPRALFFNNLRQIAALIDAETVR
ncbi:MAG: amino acid adenylation domain-containing protein [Gammaproteobacteria bacterium]